MNTDKIYAEKIASEYAPQKTSKVVALKKLHEKVTKTAEIFGLAFGILCALVFGTGLTLCLGVIGGTTFTFVLGIIVGLIGISGCIVNYFLYKKILAKGKQKYGSDIIRLAKEISEEE